MATGLITINVLINIEIYAISCIPFMSVGDTSSNFLKHFPKHIALKKEKYIKVYLFYLEFEYLNKNFIFLLYFFLKNHIFLLPVN